VSELHAKDQHIDKWLVKVPAFIYESWQGLTQDTTVGKISVIPGENSSELKLDLDGGAASYYGAPLQYDIRSSKSNHPKPGSSVVLVEDMFTGKLQLDGKIAMVAEMEAVDKVGLMQYSLSRTNNVKFAARDKSTSVHIEGGWAQGAKSGVFSNKITGVTKERDQLGNVEKNFRVSEDELEKMIIEAYTEKDEYTFKELNARLRQPEAYLKEKLGQYCVAEKREGGGGQKWVLNRDWVSVVAPNKKLKTEPGQSPGSAPNGGKK
jgi:hypothetical protein